MGPAPATGDGVKSESRAATETRRSQRRNTRGMEKNMMSHLERYGPASDGIFRVLFSLIFIVAGIGHFLQKDVMLARLAAAPLGHLASFLGPPDLLMTISGAALVLGGNFLDYDFLSDDPVHHGKHGQHLGILLVEGGVGITVAAVMLAIFYAFAGRRHSENR